MNPFQEALQESWLRLAEEVRQAHNVPLEANGYFDVQTRYEPLPRLLNLPRPGKRKRVELKTSEIPGGVEWLRQLGDHRFTTVHRAEAGSLIETSGNLDIVFRLSERAGALIYESIGCRTRVPRLALPLKPSILAVVEPSAAGWTVEVVVALPVFGWICRYGGQMRPA
jgi:hypothetical protein